MTTMYQFLCEGAQRALCDVIGQLITSVSLANNNDCQMTSGSVSSHHQVCQLFKLY